MASNQTGNYGLSQWEAADAVQRVEFNADNAKVDAALKSLSDQVVQKANQSALNTVISAVNQKADAATVSSLLNSEVAQRQAADNSLQTALALKGNCQIYYGTYTGDGQRSRTLTFSGRPLLVQIMGGNLQCLSVQGNPNLMCRTNGSAGEVCSVSWSGNTFTWSGYSEYCANNSGETYYVAALIAVDE